MCKNAAQLFRFILKSMEIRMDSCIEKTQVYVATAKSLSLGLPLQFIDPLLELGKMLDYAET